MDDVPHIALKDLLTVEDDPALLDFCCNETGLPLWPQIRVMLFRMMMSDLFYGVRITGKSNAPRSWGRATATMLRSLFHNYQYLHGEKGRARICITSEGVADQWIAGHWFNRLTDYFVTSRPLDTMVLADHFEWRWPFPRRHGRMIMHAPWQAANAVRSKMFVQTKHLSQAEDLVQLVADRAKRYLDWELDAERRHMLISILARKSASIVWQYNAYTRLLQRVRPQVLMVGAGCYGPAASLIAAAKSMGICTAEYQHGAISAGHDAYNFAPAIQNSAIYKRTLPEYFLGYGKWWNDQINAPVQKLAIGNPHRGAKISSLNSERKDVKSDLLILSDGIEFNLYLELARSLRGHAEAMGLRVVLRPHPLERTAAFQMTGIEEAGFVIDRNSDIYQSLNTAHTVISEVSTGLFEAVGIVKRILIWDTPKSRFGYPSHPFETFDSIEALLDKLSGVDDLVFKEKFKSEDIWAENWELNFNNFLVNLGVD